MAGIKAILRRGVFTCMIDISSPDKQIDIPMIDSPMSFTKYGPPSTASVTGERWRFRLLDQLERDIYLYEYEGKV